MADQDTNALISTEVITAAVYDIAQLNVPVTWTKAEEVKNTSATQKVALVKSKLENGIQSHDDQIETNIFTTSSAGGIEILGLDQLVTSAGTGTPGGIDASIETFWANQAEAFTDASDIEAAFTEVFKECAKGSGSPMQPTVIISGSDTHTLFDSQLQSLQRFQNVDEADAGYKVLSFMGAKYLYSHKGGTSAYFLNPKNYKLVVSKQYFRDKGPTQQIQGQNAFYFLIYSALQFVVNNRSRLGVAYQS